MTVARSKGTGHGKLRRALLLITAGLLALLLLLSAILAWLVFTESGTRQLFSTLARFELLSYQDLQGSLSDGLQIETLTVNSNSASAQITELSFSADWGELFYAKLLINELSARSVSIALPDSEPDTAAQDDFNLEFLNDRLVFMPLTVVLQHLSVQQLSILQAGQRHHLQHIKLSSLLNQRGISATRLSLVHEQTSLQLLGDVALAPKLAIDLTLNWQSSFADGSRLTGEAQLKGNKQQLGISHQSRGSLSSNVDIKLSNWLKQPQLTLQGSVDKLAWPLNSTSPPLLSALKLNAEGDLSALHTRLSGQLQLHESDSAAFQLAALLSRDKLEVSRLQLFDNLGGSAEISAQVSWLAAVPRWQALLQLNNFNGQLLHPFSPQQLTGKLSVEGNYDTKLQLDIAASKLQGVLHNRAFDAQLNASFQGDNIQIQQLNASVGDNRLTLSGRLEPAAFKVMFNSQFNELNALLPSSSGKLQASGLLSGTVHKPTLTAQLVAQELKLPGFSATDINLAIELLDGVFSKTGNQLDAHNLRYQSVYLDRLDVKFSGGWQTPVIALQTSSPLLHINAKSELQFDKSERISGQLSQLQVKADNIGSWQLEAPVLYQSAAHGWSLSPLCLVAGDGRICLSAAGAAEQLEASLDARQLPLSLLNASGLLTPQISGQLDINASVKGPVQQLEGQLLVAQSHPNSPLVLTADDDANTQITIAGLSAVVELTNGSVTGSLNARLNETGSLSSEFTIEQLLAAHSPLQARIDYTIPDLQPYARLIPEVDALSGELAGYIKLDNSLQQPRLSLFTRLKVPHIYISPLAMEWTDLEAEIITLSGSKQQVNATVTAGEGQLKLSGKLSFTSLDDWLSELHIEGENALLMDQKDRRIVASPDFHLSADASGLNLEGLLHIPEAKIKIKPSPSRLSLTSDAVIHNAHDDVSDDTTPYRFDLNLAVSLGDKVNVEAYGLKTGVTGMLRLSRQSPGALLGTGELNLVDGAYQAYGQDLVIERGVIRLTGLLSRPEIELSASRTVQGIKAGLRVNGPVDDLRTRLYSEPALPDSEILSYIIRGQPLHSASDADKNALANMLLAYSISQTSPVTAKLTELSGFDEIGLVAEEGVETLGLTLGKYITPRLYARYGVGVIDKLSRVFLQYQLSDRLYLEGMSGQGQSVDLMYRSR